MTARRKKCDNFPEKVVSIATKGVTHLGKKE